MLPTFDFWNTVKLAGRALYASVRLPIFIYVAKCILISSIFTFLFAFSVEALSEYVHIPILEVYVNDLSRIIINENTNIPVVLIHLFAIDELVYQIELLAKSFALALVAIGVFWFSFAMYLKTYGATKALNDSTKQIIDQIVK